MEDVAESFTQPRDGRAASARQPAKHLEEEELIVRLSQGRASKGRGLAPASAGVLVLQRREQQAGKAEKDRVGRTDATEGSAAHAGAEAGRLVVEGVHMSPYRPQWSRVRWALFCRPQAFPALALHLTPRWLVGLTPPPLRYAVRSVCAFPEPQKEPLRG
jgi:hypothetical protein